MKIESKSLKRTQNLCYDRRTNLGRILTCDKIKLMLLEK